MRTIRFILLAFGLLVVTLALLIAFGGPSTPAPMASINDPFKSVDFSDLPPVSTFKADDGASLAYRKYLPAATAKPAGSVTLIHGSSANSNSMHPMARALAAAGYTVFALDMRGHGQSGTKGHIDHIGQLDSDLAAFARAVQPPQPSTLVGFSAGGGFVLRIAGGPQQSLFGSYLLLSPFLSQKAPNLRPGGGGWASVGIARAFALVVLNKIGIHALNDLTITRFALNEKARAMLTPEYDYNLVMNFRPEFDYEANIRHVQRPCAIIAGSADEAFFTDKLEGIVRGAGQQWPVVLLPGLGHIPLTLDPSALQAIVQQVQALQQQPAH
ncbi:alpha/beta hydrolase [Piscinibacter terrae]|uniref:Alpha/beta hydrolase n=1 Tax=Piscinibacter terrae TaxID=2496871 RepID=A0A3N7HRU7_9BURK|nr:alpha/beta hydrolase [Albitalea terrae]RQP24914.1 alpha/beta hydrolase [Albitalea terrae]